MAGKIKNITTKCVLIQTGITSNTYPVNGVPGVELTAFTQTFTAENNFVFNTPPSIDFSNVDDPNDYLVTVTDTKVNNVITVRLFSIKYTPDVKLPLNDEIVFVANAEAGYNPSTGNIYSYELDTSFLKSNGDNRSLKMLGDPGAVINVAIFNTTPGYASIDMYNRTYTFQSNGTSLSYVDGTDTIIVDSIDFNIPGLKYWRVPIGDEVIRITFSVTGANTILWDPLPVTNGSAELVYLYQYKDAKVILQLSQGDTTGINSNNGFFGLAYAGSNDYIINLKDQWNRNDVYSTNWTTALNYAATGLGTDGPFAANPPRTYVSIATATPAGAGVIAETTFSSGNLTQNLVVGRTYKLTFEARVPVSVGVSGILFKHFTSNSLYSGVNGSRSIGLFGEAYSSWDGWRVINMEFVAGTVNADKLQILTTNPSNGQGVEISKIRLTPVYATGLITTAEASCSNIAILESKPAGSTTDTYQYDFKLTVYENESATNARKGINYIPTALTPVASSIPSSLLNSGNVNTDLSRGTTNVITNTVKSSDYNAYRKAYKYTSGTGQTEIDFMGALGGGYNTMNYENGCIATISNTQLKVVNAFMLTLTGSTITNTSLEFTGTLNVQKNPVGGNAVIEFNLAGWFTQGGLVT